MGVCYAVQVADVGCAVHVCSLLHCRYGDFTPCLLEQLQKTYSGKIGKDEDKVGIGGVASSRHSWHGGYSNLHSVGIAGSIHVGGTECIALIPGNDFVLFRLLSPPNTDLACDSWGRWVC